MLTTRLLFSVLRKQFPKHLSTAPAPQIENVLPEETESNKEDEILQNPDHFKVHNLFTVKDLFTAKVHYGHKASMLRQNMKPFVFGNRLGHVIFDLDVTAFHLREALNFAAHIAYRGGIILFVSKNPQMTVLVEKTALSCKEFAVTRDCPLGLFTNSSLKFRTHVRLPDLVIFLNTLEENGFRHTLVMESAKMCIPTVGVVDSNCDPNLITYPIPGNDDSYSSIQLYCGLFKKAILRAKSERDRDLRKRLESSINEESTVNKSEVKDSMNVTSSKETDSSVKGDVGSQ